MNRIPFICSDEELFLTGIKLAGQCHEQQELLQLNHSKTAIEFLNVEMPELVIIDFDDPEINVRELFAAFRNDSWLLVSGIILICDKPAALHDSGEAKGLNIVSTISRWRLSQHLPKVMNIINENRRIIFQRMFASDLVGSVSGSVFLDNDPIEANCFSNLICNFLFNLNRIDSPTRENLNLVLIELLMNAIEHGNCRISFDEKSRWLDEGNDIIDLVLQKCGNPAIANSRVKFEYSISDELSKFQISDEGDGFNWRELKDPDSGRMSFELHGRGIKLSRTLVQNLIFNEKGNSLAFEIRHQKEIANITPSLFHDLDTLDFREGETVFNIGEESNFLYYIMRGKFDVIWNGVSVSVLTPDDIFLGEMAFLLNNRRSATVKALSDGQLVRISKREFVEAIKEKPHYSLFLSRLLAQRLDRANKKWQDKNIIY